MALKTARSEAEEWREVPGTSGAYWVSDQGRVLSYTSGNGQGARRAEPRFLKGRIGDTGYPRVSIRVHGSRRTVYIHRLVLIAFRGLPVPPRTVAAHLDGSRNNNLLSNLEWVTYAENESHKDAHGTRKAKLTRKDAEEIRNSDSPASDLAARFNIKPVTVNAIRRGCRWRPLKKENAR